jgi:hypothetical protein
LLDIRIASETSKGYFDGKENNSIHRYHSMEKGHLQADETLEHIKAWLGDVKELLIILRTKRSGITSPNKGLAEVILEAQTKEGAIASRNQRQHSKLSFLIF